MKEASVRSFQEDSVDSDSTNITESDPDLSVADTVERIAAGFGTLSLMRPIRVCRDLLAEDAPIDVAIVGQIRRAPSASLLITPICSAERIAK